MHYFEKAFEKGELIFPGNTEPLGTHKGFKDLKMRLWAKEWVVYSKKPFVMAHDTIFMTNLPLGKLTKRSWLAHDPKNTLYNPHRY